MQIAQTPEIHTPATLPPFPQSVLRPHGEFILTHD